MSSLPRMVAIVGPTAAGKEALALEVAARLHRPLIVCDSVKVYRGLDIGSAKPTAEARRRVVHHMLDCVEPDAPFSAGDYAREALPIAQREGGIFVGGTGLYLKAVALSHTQAPDGRDDLSRESPERAAFEAEWIAREFETPGAAHEALCAIDAPTAEAIHPRNAVRVIRALWLCHFYGEAVSARRSSDPPRPRVDLLLLFLDPGQDVLDERIKRRLDAMLSAGWLGEVEKLREAGYDSRHKSMRSLGYRELLDVAEGRATMAAARQAIYLATRQYARRQRVFFRRQFPHAQFVHLHDPQQCPFGQIEAFLNDSDESHVRFGGRP